MRSMRLAALTVAVTLALTGLSVAGDHDYFDRHKDDHSKHDHYKDKHEDHHDWGHVFNHDRDRDRNDHHWWQSAREKEREHDRWERDHRNVIYGNSPVYNRYPGGYGYPGGSYPVGSVYGRGGYGGYGGYGGSSGAGYRQGMEDGSYQARKDISQGKPFNPNPRGSSHSDHGYNSSMGDKHVYQASYDQGYHSGYQSNYGGGGRRGWGF